MKAFVILADPEGKLASRYEDSFLELTETEAGLFLVDPEDRPRKGALSVLRALEASLEGDPRLIQSGIAEELDD